MVNIINESKTLFSCIKHNASIVIVPGMIILFGVIATGDYEIFKLLFGIIYLFLFILTFDISDQINGVTEDIINKTERPLATGYWNLNQAWNYLITSNSIFAGVGLFLGVFPYALAWILVSSFHNFFGYEYWYLKNHISLSIGAFILLSSTYEISHPINRSSLTAFIVVAWAGGMGVITQDFKDIDGDKILGCRTLPIIFKESIAIKITAVSLIVGHTIFDIYFILDKISS